MRFADLARALSDVPGWDVFGFSRFDCGSYITRPGVHWLICDDGEGGAQVVIDEDGTAASPALADRIIGEALAAVA